VLSELHEKGLDRAAIIGFVTEKMDRYLYLNR